MSKKLIVTATATGANRSGQGLVHYRGGPADDSFWDLRRGLARPVDKCEADEVAEHVRLEWTDDDRRLWLVGFEEVDDG